MTKARLVVLAPVLVFLNGCFSPEIMLAADVVTAAVKAGMHYAEKAKPTPELAWQQNEVDRVKTRAVAGDAEAEYELALFYQATHRAQAATWMCRAAENGHRKAQLQLGHWHNEDRNREDLWPFVRITPDNRRAYAWYRVALTNGEASAQHYLSRLKPMSLRAIAEAESRAANNALGDCTAIATAATVSSPETPN